MSTPDRSAEGPTPTGSTLAFAEPRHAGGVVLTLTSGLAITALLVGWFAWVVARGAT